MGWCQDVEHVTKINQMQRNMRAGTLALLTDNVTRLQEEHETHSPAAQAGTAPSYSSVREQAA